MSFRDCLFCLCTCMYVCVLVYASMCVRKCGSFYILYILVISKKHFGSSIFLLVDYDVVSTFLLFTKMPKVIQFVFLCKQGDAQRSKLDTWRTEEGVAEL